MKRLTQIGLFCAVVALGWLLGACAPTPTAPAVDPSPSGLSATLEAPSSLPDGEVVKLTFTLTNHSPEKRYVLDWYTPLEGIFGEILRIERDGQAIPYEGPLVMRGDPLPENYVLLDAGASVSAGVDLATVYDFSQPGEYIIEFISPRISHVARTGREFAASVDDLGPVQIPCNTLTLTVEGSSASPVRQAPAEAAARIRAYLHSQKLALAPDFPLALEELPLPDGWEPTRVFSSRSRTSWALKSWAPRYPGSIDTIRASAPNLPALH